ncbi:hypothetical protein ACK3SF_04825 [Candidatus Nanosalina sp. VS9-1]|uniref:hypothetical protein n=1 Tax=Candidatus Nanosalina sp. VS9-1 TaxID=3388566 RepID=UPI0039E13445
MEYGDLDERMDQVFPEGGSSYEFEAAVNAGKVAGEACYETVHFLVHPGWAAKNYDKDWEDDDRKDLFMQDFYRQYMAELRDVLEQTSDEEPVHVIYSEDGRSHAETIVEQFNGEAAGYTESLLDSGEVQDVNFQEIRETVEKLSATGEIKVHGEIAGRCHSVFQNQLDEETDPTTEIQEGVTFPPEPTWNYVFTTNTWHK